MNKRAKRRQNMNKTQMIEQTLEVPRIMSRQEIEMFKQ
jgi:hypothetical protein